MKRITIIIFLMLFSLGYSQSFPLDFETPTVFTNFDGSNATLVDNPSKTGINTSNTVAKIIRSGGSDYEGSYVTLAASVNMSNKVFKIKVYCPVAGQKLLLKFEGAGSAFEKNSVAFTTANVWQELTLDFTGVTVNNLNNKIIFMFNAGKKGDGTLNSTYYFDDVIQVVPEGTPTIAFSIPPKFTTDEAFSLLPLINSNSAGAFTFISSKPEVATISNTGIVTIVGAGTTTITANQEANGIYIAGSATANLVVESRPIVAAPKPPRRNPSDVISLFSDAYTDITNVAWGTEWCPGSAQDVLIEGNLTKKIINLGCLGVDFNTNRFDATDFTNFHMDFWSANTDLIGKVMNPKFSQWGGGGGEVSAFLLTYLPTVAGTWISIDVPLKIPPFMGNMSRSDIAQFILTSNLGVVYVDNIYLYKGTPLGIEKFEASSVKMFPNPAINSLTIEAKSRIEKVTIYSVLGQEVIAKYPNSNTITLQTGSLQKGAYIVKSIIEGKTVTSKLIKE